VVAIPLPNLVVLLLIIFGTILRLILATSLGLGVDESYVVSVARTLSFSYFDHPPLHFWLVWLITHLTGSECPMIVRLPFILLFAGSTWLMYRLGQRLFSAWAGVYAALLFNVSAVFSLSSGSWVLPDGPLFFSMLSAALALEKIFFRRSTNGRWLEFGFWLGIGLLCKYHAVFLLFGVLLYILVTKKHYGVVLTPGPYLSLVVAGILFLPVLLWNADHSWVSFVFQGSRGVGHGFYPGKMLTNILGQALWVLPWIWIPLIGAAVLSVKKKQKNQLSPLKIRYWFFLCLSAFPIIFFTVATLWGAQGLFHWQAPGYLFLFPLLGEKVAVAIRRGRRTTKLWLKGSVASFLIIVVILGTHAATGWLHSFVPSLSAKNDPTLEALDWRGMESNLTARGVLAAPVGFVVTASWIDGGKVDYALAGRLPVLTLNDAPHHFAFTHNLADYQGQDALIIGQTKYVGDATQYQPYFDSIVVLDNIPIQRNGQQEIELAVFYGKNFKGQFPLPYGYKTTPKN